MAATAFPNVTATDDGAPESWRTTRLMEMPPRSEAERGDTKSTAADDIYGKRIARGGVETPKERVATPADCTAGVVNWNR